MLACATCFASKEGHPSSLFVSLSGNSGSSLLAFSPLLALFGGTRGCFQSFVADCLYIEKGKDVFSMGGTVKSFLFGSENFSSPVLFLLFDGAVQESL